MNPILYALPVLVVVALHFLSRQQYIVHNNGIVLITGASSGIGRHAAEFLASKHEYLVLAGVRKESDAEAIRKLGVKNLQPIIIDVTNHDSVLKAVDEIKTIEQEKHLSLVGLVNNAGVSRTLIAEYHSLDDARAVFDTNFFGVVDLVQQTLPLLRASKGRIINISSVLGFLSTPKFGIYSASKFALESFSDALRREVADFGISVTVVEPAFVKTAIQDKMATASSQITSETADEKEMKSLYGRFLSAAEDAKFAKEVETADGPMVTSVAIEEALVSPFPPTRRQAAHGGGMHAAVIRWVAWLFNDRILDLIVKYN